MDSGHSVSDKLEPDKEKFCVVQGSGQWWVSNIVQQNFGQLYVRCWPKYDLTGIWGWTNVLYDLKLRRFCLGVALKTNTWGLVLAGSREAERITSQIEQGQWTKKQQRKGSVTFNIFLSSQFDFCPQINISTFQLNYFPKNEGLAWSSWVMQLQLPHRGEKHHIYTIWPCLLLCSHSFCTECGWNQWHIKHIDHGGTF